MRLPLFLHKFASPRYFYAMAGFLIPWLAALFAGLLIVGLFTGFVLAPTHSEQGESYRIIFIHVPSASLSMGIYVFMAVAGLIFLVWRMKMADIMAAAAAPIGAAFTFLALVTGSIWGRPTWGTWWEWDARLTSELVLLFLFLGYMALRNAIDDRQKAGRAGAVLALVGVVNIPIIHFSVEWWNTLHQGATISKMSSPTIESTMLTALLLCMLALWCLFGVALLVRGRCLVLQQELRSSWVSELPAPRSLLPVLVVVLLAGGWSAWQYSTLSHEPVFGVSAALQQTASDAPITVRGRVDTVQSNGTENRFRLSEAGNTVEVLFNGTLPKEFRTHWGARVVATAQADGTLLASRVAALNIRDHRGYIIAAYGIFAVMVLFSLIAPARCHSAARRGIARRLRREKS